MVQASHPKAYGILAMNLPLLRWLNTLLTANFFFVLASFLWFVIALLGRSFQVPLGFDLWYRLWQPLFQPAIGVLMLGAIVSGVGGWLLNKIAAWRKEP
jgi:hypothetical protein